jgi:hypothetical protein
MRNTHYILRGTEVVETDVLTWVHWFETADRHVARTQIADALDVSTVFLGLDHRYGDGPPLLFETLPFWHGDSLEQFMQRYSTWQDAEQGHEAVCAQVRCWLAQHQDE